MLHRVGRHNHNMLEPNERMMITPEFLEDTIKHHQKDYEFVSSDKAYQIISGAVSSRKKFILFTFDDGYRDNYEKAFPVFKRYNIPFTLFLTSGFPDHKAVLWWYIIEDIITSQDEIILSDGTTMKCRSQEEKTDSFFLLRNKVLCFTRSEFNESFLKLFSNYKFDLYKKTKELSITWAQLDEMSRSGLCTVGAHSVTHSNFSTLSATEIKTEIVQSISDIESRIGKKVEHFSYPYGSADEINRKTLQLVKELPIKTAALSYGGRIYANKKYHGLALPRVMLTDRS